MISPTGTGYVNYVAVETAEYLSRALGQRPADRRPRVVLFGESLGAWTSQDAFAQRGTQGHEATVEVKQAEDAAV